MAGGKRGGERQQQRAGTERGGRVGFGRAEHGKRESMFCHTTVGQDVIFAE